MFLRLIITLLAKQNRKANNNHYCFQQASSVIQYELMDFKILRLIYFLWKLAISKLKNNYFSKIVSSYLHCHFPS
jgi:hypothetical protein